MNLNDYELRRTTKCDCGKELSINNILPPVEVCNDIRYYGGRVNKTTKVKCSVCNKTYLGLIDDTFNLFDTMNTISEIQEETSSVEEIPEENLEISDNEETENTYGNDTDVGTINEEDTYVCPKCGKVCKSASGLNSHCKKCIEK